MEDIIKLKTNLVEAEYDEDKPVELGPYGPFPSASACNAWWMEVHNELELLNKELFQARDDPGKIEIIYAFDRQFAEDEVLPVQPARQVIEHIKHLWNELEVALPVS